MFVFTRCTCYARVLILHACIHVPRVHSSFLGMWSCCARVLVFQACAIVVIHAKSRVLHTCYRSTQVLVLNLSARVPREIACSTRGHVKTNSCVSGHGCASSNLINITKKSQKVNMDNVYAVNLYFSFKEKLL